MHHGIELTGSYFQFYKMIGHFTINNRHKSITIPGLTFKYVLTKWFIPFDLLNNNRHTAHLPNNK